MACAAFAREAASAPEAWCDCSQNARRSALSVVRTCTTSAIAASCRWSSSICARARPASAAASFPRRVFSSRRSAHTRSCSRALPAWRRFSSASASAFCSRRWIVPSLLSSTWGPVGTRVARGTRAPKHTRVSPHSVTHAHTHARARVLNGAHRAVLLRETNRSPKGGVCSTKLWQACSPQESGWNAARSWQSRCARRLSTASPRRHRCGDLRQAGAPAPARSWHRRRRHRAGLPRHPPWRGARACCTAQGRRTRACPADINRRIGMAMFWRVPLPVCPRRGACRPRCQAGHVVVLHRSHAPLL